MKRVALTGSSLLACVTIVGLAAAQPRMPRRAPPSATARQRIEQARRHTAIVGLLGALNDASVANLWADDNLGDVLATMGSPPAQGDAGAMGIMARQRPTRDAGTADASTPTSDAGGTGPRRIEADRAPRR